MSCSVEWVSCNITTSSLSDLSCSQTENPLLSVSESSYIYGSNIKCIHYLVWRDTLWHSLFLPYSEPPNSWGYFVSHMCQHKICQKLPKYVYERFKRSSQSKRCKVQKALYTLCTKVCQEKAFLPILPEDTAPDNFNSITQCWDMHSTPESMLRHAEVLGSMEPIEPTVHSVYLVYNVPDSYLYCYCSLSPDSSSVYPYSVLRHTGYIEAFAKISSVNGQHETHVVSSSTG